MIRAHAASGVRLTRLGENLMVCRIIAACALIGSVSAAASCQEWPGWRGSTYQGIAMETEVPLQWTATENIAWKTPLPGDAWSSPIVWGERVFVTTATEEGQSCRVLALDRQTGRIVWDREVFRQVPGHKEARNSYATPTPVTDGTLVYACFYDGSFAALDFSGQVVWTNREHKFYSQHGLGSSPKQPTAETDRRHSGFGRSARLGKAGFDVGVTDFSGV